MLPYSSVDEKDISQVLKRYSLYDKSKNGTDGIKYNQVKQFPEFRLNPFMPRVLELYTEEEQKISAEKFVYLMAALDSRMNIDHKRKCKWKIYSPSTCTCILIY